VLICDLSLSEGLPLGCRLRRMLSSFNCREHAG
jgi:hypothetical protein